MVRFARSHGSKGSNERVPEEATSWEDMKQQLQVVSSTINDQNGSPSPAKKSFVFKRTSDNVPVKWAEFEPTQIPEIKTNIKNCAPSIVLVESVPKRKKSKKRKDHLEQDATHKVSSKSIKIKKDKPTAIDRLCKNVMKKCAIDPSIVTSLTDKDNSKLSKKQRKAEKNKLSKVDADKQKGETENSISKKSRKRKRQLQKKSLLDKKSDSSTNNVPSDRVVDPSTPVGVISKRQKRNLKHQLKKNATAQQTAPVKHMEENGSADSTGLVETKASRCKKDRQGANPLKSSTKPKQHKRRKPEQAVTVMQFNGRDVEVVQFDGFPVRKQDADRLVELRSQMVANLIPKEEIDHTMKMERRKAEKALARERKKVCFHCRKSGHNLSECPELGEEAQHEAPPSGICYKCGSTEHTHFECRVNRGQEFRFAKCFICNEQGHISNQCPDNPRGLYPKGGGCKVCGDVTHLKKNCPDLINKKEESGMTLSTVQSAGIELLDEDMRDEDCRPALIAPKAKVVKF